MQPQPGYFGLPVYPSTKSSSENIARTNPKTVVPPTPCNGATISHAGTGPAPYTHPRSPLYHKSTLPSTRRVPGGTLTPQQQHTQHLQQQQQQRGQLPQSQTQQRIQYPTTSQPKTPLSRTSTWQTNQPVDPVNKTVPPPTKNISSTAIQHHEPSVRTPIQQTISPSKTIPQQTSVLGQNVCGPSADTLTPRVVKYTSTTQPTRVVPYASSQHTQSYVSQQTYPVHNTTQSVSSQSSKDTFVQSIQHNSTTNDVQMNALNSTMANNNIINPNYPPSSSSTSSQTSHNVPLTSHHSFNQTSSINTNHPSTPLTSNYYYSGTSSSYDTGLTTTTAIAQHAHQTPLLPSQNFRERDQTTATTTPIQNHTLSRQQQAAVPTSQQQTPNQNLFYSSQRFRPTPQQECSSDDIEDVDRIAFIKPKQNNIPACAPVVDSLRLSITTFAHAAETFSREMKAVKDQFHLDEFNESDLAASSGGDLSRVCKWMDKMGFVANNIASLTHVLSKQDKLAAKTPQFVGTAATHSKVTTSSASPQVGYNTFELFMNHPLLHKAVTFASIYVRHFDEDSVEDVAEAKIGPHTESTKKPKSKPQKTVKQKTPAMSVVNSNYDLVFGSNTVVKEEPDYPDEDDQETNKHHQVPSINSNGRRRQTGFTSQNPNHMDGDDDDDDNDDSVDDNAVDRNKNQDSVPNSGSNRTPCPSTLPHNVDISTNTPQTPQKPLRKAATARGTPHVKKQRSSQEDVFLSSQSNSVSFDDFTSLSSSYSTATTTMTNPNNNNNNNTPKSSIVPFHLDTFSTNDEDVVGSQSISHGTPIPTVSDSRDQAQYTTPIPKHRSISQQQQVQPLTPSSSHFPPLDPAWVVIQPILTTLSHFFSSGLDILPLFPAESDTVAVRSYHSSTNNIITNSILSNASTHVSVILPCAGTIQGELSFQFHSQLLKQASVSSQIYPVFPPSLTLLLQQQTNNRFVVPLSCILDISPMNQRWEEDIDHNILPLYVSLLTSVSKSSTTTQESVFTQLTTTLQQLRHKNTNLVAPPRSSLIEIILSQYTNHIATLQAKQPTEPIGPLSREHLSQILAFCYASSQTSNPNLEKDISPHSAHLPTTPLISLQKYALSQTLFANLSNARSPCTNVSSKILYITYLQPSHTPSTFNTASTPTLQSKLFKIQFTSVQDMTIWLLALQFQASQAIITWLESIRIHNLKK